MTSEELKNAAVSVLEKPYHTQLYLILKVGDELIMRLADIEDENTAPEIQRMFVGFVNNTIISNDNIIIRSLSVADELPNAIYEYDYESYSERRWASRYRATRPSACPPTNRTRRSRC